MRNKERVFNKVKTAMEYAQKEMGRDFDNQVDTDTMAIPRITTTRQRLEQEKANHVYNIRHHQDNIDRIDQALKMLDKHKELENLINLINL